MRVVIAVADLMARSRLESGAQAAGYEVAAVSAVPGPEAEAPGLLVADLDQPGALERIEAFRAAHPETPVTGFAFHVNRETLDRAERLGVRTLHHGASAADIFGNPPPAGAV